VKSTAENLSPTRVRLSVEVPSEEIKPSLDAAYKKIGAQIRVPGFRPGKVPARIIDQRIGRAAVLEEAVNEVVPRTYVEAAREHDLKTLGQPDIEVTNADGDAISFTAEVDIRPEIQLPSLEGIAVSVDDAEVTDADVDEQLSALRERFGSLKTVERAVQSGDFVTIDFSASIDGAEIESVSRKGMSYEVGSGDLLDGLDEAITGKSAGETATFTTTVEQGEHAGEDAEITVTVNSVKEKELPELDDEFAQLASEFDTIDELRDDLRERLGNVKKMEQGAQARDKLLEQLVETVEFPVPESAIKAEVDFREHEIVHSLGHDDTLFERYLDSQGKTREQFTDELREGAEQAVRAQFVLDAIADTTEVQVGDAELTEYLVRQAARYNMPPQEFANQIMQAGNLPALVQDVRRNKALADVLEQAAITDASGNTIDLQALTAELAEAAAAEAEEAAAVDAAVEAVEAATEGGGEEPTE
jgi:trigger factor